MTDKVYTVATTRHNPKTGQILSQELIPSLKPMTHREAVTFISKQSNYPNRGFILVELSR